MQLNYPIIIVHFACRQSFSVCDRYAGLYIPKWIYITHCEMWVYLYFQCYCCYCSTIITIFDHKPTRISACNVNWESCTFQVNKQVVYFLYIIWLKLQALCHDFCKSLEVYLHVKFFVCFFVRYFCKLQVKNVNEEFKSSLSLKHWAIRFWSTVYKKSYCQMVQAQ